MQQGDSNTTEYNKVSLPILRSIPLYDDKGDIAYCRIQADNWLQSATGKALFISEKGISKMGRNIHLKHATYKKAGNEIKIIFYFSLNKEGCREIIEFINSKNKYQNFVLGYPGYKHPDKALIGARDNQTKMDNNFVYIKPEVDEEFNFLYDAPNYDGMSGGPIFLIEPDLNTVHVYGMIRGYHITDNIHSEGTFLKVQTKKIDTKIYCRIK